MKRIKEKNSESLILNRDGSEGGWKRPRREWLLGCAF